MKAKLIEAMKTTAQNTALPDPPVVADAKLRWPTVEQLAHIAATLAAAKPSEPSEKAAARAFDLWTACGAEIVNRWRERMDLRQTAATAEPPFPAPSRYPATLSEFLRIGVGGKYKADRLHQWRAFVREHVRAARVGALLYPPGQSAVSMSEREAFAKVPLPGIQDPDVIRGMRKSFQDAEEFETCLADFKKWLEKSRCTRRREQRHAAAVAKWNQKRRQKGKAAKLAFLAE